MATHSSILAWRIPWTEEPGGLQSMGSHRVEHDWRDLAACWKDNILPMLGDINLVHLFLFILLHVILEHFKVYAWVAHRGEKWLGHWYILLTIYALFWHYWLYLLSQPASPSLPENPFCRQRNWGSDLSFGKLKWASLNFLCSWDKVLWPYFVHSVPWPLPSFLTSHVISGLGSWGWPGASSILSPLWDSAHDWQRF